jgi:spermidine synthase
VIVLDLVAFVTGAATMSAELAAGRLVAPWYGTSTPIWAVLIGAVLSSLALGQLLGGLLARRDPQAQTLGLLLESSAVLLAILPFVARLAMSGSMSWFRDGNVTMLAAGFAAITAMLALPITALGACGPILLHLAVRPDEGRIPATGAVAGRIYALGTAGSLFGTYLSGLVLVPWAGSRAALLASACVLGLVGLLVLVRGRTRIVAGTVLMLMVAAGPLLSIRPLKERKGAIYESETRNQYLQVVDDGHARKLYLNEGYALQSLLPLDGSVPTYGVWGFYALSPAWTVAGPPARVLILGLGGGTSARIFRRLYPASMVTGVEIDPEVVAVGRRYFALPDDVRVIADDARAALHHPPLSDERSAFDVILADAFQFPYIPFQLCTIEFFRELDARLAQGGALVLNVGRDERSHDVVDAVSTTLAMVFPVVRGVDVPDMPNTLLVATRHPVSEDAGVEKLGLSGDLAGDLRHLPVPRTWTPAAGAMVLTDDRAPVEALTDRVIVRRLWFIFRNGGWKG